MADKLDDGRASVSATTSSSPPPPPPPAHTATAPAAISVRVVEATQTPAAATSSDAASPRSASFSGQTAIGISSATLWRNKSVSCESIRSFESARKAQIDTFQERDRIYWQYFEKEIMRARDENTRLQRFFTLRIQADMAYAEALHKLRAVVERPTSGLPSGATSTGGSPGAATTSSSSSDALSVSSTCVKALNALGEVQQQVSEKMLQLTTAVKRDVVARPLEEMAQTLEERTTAMLADGNRLDAALHAAQRSVLDAFRKFDAIFREMETEKLSNIRVDTKRDLWLAEIAYCIAVQRLRQRRVEYVKGMSGLFQQYKTLEVLRVSVIQTAVDTYLRKQKLTYEELAGAMSDPMAAAQRIEPERDLIYSIRRIPKNYTAAALSTENTDEKLFSMLRSPISSPLLLRCGFLKHQVSNSLFKSWKDVLCAITQDQFLHLIELKDSATRAIVQSSEAMLEAISTQENGTDVLTVSVDLSNCQLVMNGKSAVPTFEVMELSQGTGLFSSVFRIESSRKFTFQCTSQSDLIDWVVAVQRFIPSGSATATRR